MITTLTSASITAGTVKDDALGKRGLAMDQRKLYDPPEMLHLPFIICRYGACLNGQRDVNETRFEAGGIKPGSNGLRQKK